MTLPENRRAKEHLSAEILTTPVPNLSVARANKDGYKDWPIDVENLLYKESLVPITDYGLAGQAYYSRPNAAISEGIAEVPKELYLRKTLAERLALINSKLGQSSIFNVFGGPVELYIEDGHRGYSLQKELFENVFPLLIRQQNPGISYEQLEERLQGLIAAPSEDSTHPSPHSTGGAVDIMLRYKQGTPDYVAGSEVYIGHEDADTSKHTYPDYFELLKPSSGDDRLAAVNRRAFYAIMTGEAFEIDTQLQVNPTEWWHWSYGDQMWAKLRHEPAALYGGPAESK
jgi:zinc D-Ala-D-Ala dipeptidase